MVLKRLIALSTKFDLPREKPTVTLSLRVIAQQPASWRFCPVVGALQGAR